MPRLSTYIICSTLFFSSCATRYSQRGTLAWKEDFSNLQLDTANWSKIPRGKSDWNRHMSNADSLFEIRKGKLLLRGVKNDFMQGDTAKYITGGVYTKDKVNFGFGRVEIRAKLNGAIGAWPAFWFLAQDKRWPEGGEIDLVERLNHDGFIYQTVHTPYTLDLNIKTNPISGGKAQIKSKKYNTYALEKYADSLVFYVNGKKTFSYARIKTDKRDQFPFSESEHYLLLDMQLGGNWVGRIEDKDLPVEMKIDWVRFYKF